MKNIAKTFLYIIQTLRDLKTNDDVGKLDQDSYLEMLKEAKQEGVKTPYHVYARTQTYQTNKVKFYQVPDKILLHLGLNENSDSYNNEENKLWN